MRRAWRLLVAAVCCLLLLGLPATAGADPSEDPEDAHGEASHSGPPDLPLFSGPSAENMTLVGNSDKDGAVNSDLAFYRDLAFAGNFDGFRILDISKDDPRVLVDFRCRGPQSDLSVHKARGRLLLFQSVDRPQDRPDCTSRDTPVSSGRAEFGFEGIRVFDVTNPRRPQFLKAVATDCGSHTNTLIPDKRNQRVLLYISSYPLGVGINQECQPPHRKISIVEVPERSPEDARLLKEQPLSTDTTPAPGLGFQGCHDIQAFLKEKVAVGACAGDGQLWDISDPADPTTTDADENRHTHIRFGVTAADTFEFIHNAIVTWDAEVFAIADETGGGGTAECDGEPPERGGSSTDGFYYFYDMVEPGAPDIMRARGRYTIPRPQATEICVSHNGNVIPVRDRYLLSSAYYQGGNSVVDFSDPEDPREIAYSDLEDSTGSADSWSTYWYNDRVFANGGLDRRGANGNRGLDVFTVTDEDGRTLRARKFKQMNPQTQETSQTTGGRGSR